MGEEQNKLILLEYLARGICWRINNLCARGNISLSLFSRIPYIHVTRFKLPVFQALKASRKLFPDGLTTRKKEHYDYTVNAKSANAKHNYADSENRVQLICRNDDASNFKADELKPFKKLLLHSKLCVFLEAISQNLPMARLAASYISRQVIQSEIAHASQFTLAEAKSCITGAHKYKRVVKCLPIFHGCSCRCAISVSSSISLVWDRCSDNRDNYENCFGRASQCSLWLLAVGAEAREQCERFIEILQIIQTRKLWMKKWWAQRTSTAGVDWAEQMAHFPRTRGRFSSA